MANTIFYTVSGAIFGAIGAGCLFVAGFFIELFNFGCAVLTCNCDRPDAFDWSKMWGLLLICTIGGAVIGFFYGLYKAKEESNATYFEEVRKQREEWAVEIKQKALSVNNSCILNSSSVKPLVSTTYKSHAQMTSIINELTEVSELQGKVDSLSEGLLKKGSI